MKVYIVDYIWNNDEITKMGFLDQLHSAYYVGTSYAKATSTYKRSLKGTTQPDKIKFLSFDVDKFDDCSTISSVQTDAELIKIAGIYENSIRGICCVRSSLVKDGKITVVLEKDYFNTEAVSQDKYNRYAKRIIPVTTEWTIDKDTKIEVLQEVTKQWVEDNNITIPFKVNLEGKSICKYNQK